jgi:hypothetical protein
MVQCGILSAAAQGRASKLRPESLGVDLEFFSSRGINGTARDLETEDAKAEILKRQILTSPRPIPLGVEREGCGLAQRFCGRMKNLRFVAAGFEAYRNRYAPWHADLCRIGNGTIHCREIWSVQEPVLSVTAGLGV